MVMHVLISAMLVVTDKVYSHVGLIFAARRRALNTRKGKHALAHRACGVLDSTPIVQLRKNRVSLCAR
jgi:hypothetical protein